MGGYLFGNRGLPMTEQSRYRYEKRIAELEAEVRKLRPYKSELINIYDGVAQVVTEGNTISQGWILKRIGEILR